MLNQEGTRATKGRVSAPEQRQLPVAEVVTRDAGGPERQRGQGGFETNSGCDEGLSHGILHGEDSPSGRRRSGGINSLSGVPVALQDAAVITRETIQTKRQGAQGGFQPNSRRGEALLHKILHGYVSWAPLKILGATRKEHFPCQIVRKRKCCIDS